jgi:hypothetical protein
MQPKDGGFQAAASLIPASGGHPGPPPSGQPRPPEAPTPSPPPGVAWQTRLSSVTAVARLVGYLAPRPRPQRPGQSPTVCNVLVFVCVLFYVIVRPFVFAVRVLSRPTRLLTVLRPPLHRARPTLSRPLALPCPTAAAPRPVPPLRRPQPEHACHGQVPPSSITVMHAAFSRKRYTDPGSNMTDLCSYELE